MTTKDVDKQGALKPGTDAMKSGDAELRNRVNGEQTLAGGEAQTGMGEETRTAAGPGARCDQEHGPGQDRSGPQSCAESQTQGQDQGQGQGQPLTGAQAESEDQVSAGQEEQARAEQRNLEAELETLRAEAAAWKEKAEFNWDQFLRARADLDNYRKRVERDLAFRVRLGKRDLILSFLEVLDNLERVLEAGKGLVGKVPAGVEHDGQKADGTEPEQAPESAGAGNASALIAGVEMIKRQMEALLCAEGVQPVDCLGKPFDPTLEEAIEVVEGGGEPGTVVEVVLKGYTYEGDLLRPARVKVAK